MTVLVVGANIGGSVAAGDLAAAGWDVTLIERDLARKKPCGGAIPPKAMSEFGIPESIIERKTRRAVVIGPNGSEVSMAVRGTKPRPDDYIIMVTREVLDRTMREKATKAGAELREASFVSHEETANGVRVKLRYRDGREEIENFDYLIGADGADEISGGPLGRARTDQTRVGNSRAAHAARRRDGVLSRNGGALPRRRHLTRLLRVGLPEERSRRRRNRLPPAACQQVVRVSRGGQSACG
jgi:geranylgeranyl reductase